MKRLIRFSSIYIALVISSSSLLNALSYNIYKNYRGYNLIYASGYIQKGDLKKLKRIYYSIKNSKQTIVVFNSHGGELREGIKIGRFLKDNHIGSAVKKNGICASSCALAFLGGRSKNGTKLMFLPYSSKLGFHAFYYKSSNYVKLNKVQKDISILFDYANYIGIPNFLMSKMFAIGSKKIYWINQKERRILNLKSFK